jgi:hypothetical protein
MLANPDIGVTQIAHRLGVSPATLYRWLCQVCVLGTRNGCVLVRDRRGVRTAIPAHFPLQLFNLTTPARVKFGRNPFERRDARPRGYPRSPAARRHESGVGDLAMSVVRIDELMGADFSEGAVD